MQVLSPFDRLIATEAAVRLEFVYRCQVVLLDEGGTLREYGVADPDRGHDRGTVADRLADAFRRIYDYAFQDSSQHHKVVGGAVLRHPRPSPFRPRKVGAPLPAVRQEEL